MISMLYRAIIKPFVDFVASLVALVLLLPILIMVYLILRLGGIDEPLFYQSRPGKDEKIFRIVKFKTMTDERNEQGGLLPDDHRLTHIGSVLRLSLIHISEPTRRTPISYAVFCLK